MGCQETKECRKCLIRLRHNELSPIDFMFPTSLPDDGDVVVRLFRWRQCHQGDQRTKIGCARDDASRQNSARVEFAAAALVVADQLW
jgi:hypothetical protein